jgi:murein DD-endopeptidase
MTAVLAIAAGIALGCAGSTPPASHPVSRPTASRGVDPGFAVRTAESMIGVPYKYGGASPRGFDCSGLVVYSYAAAGLRGLPHSADALSKLAKRVSTRELVPGDLVFFELRGTKPSHVGIYVGGGEFVHAPSSGKRVERVSLDHAYWRRQRGFAGRILR